MGRVYFQQTYHENVYNDHVVHVRPSLYRSVTRFVFLEGIFISLSYIILICTTLNLAEMEPMINFK